MAGKRYFNIMGKKLSLVCWYSRLIQLAFHDCLKYEDGSGGCDGCLNWAGMGYSSPRALDGTFKRHPELVGAFAKTTHTSNNKLQLSARSLELIYTLVDWPPGAKGLPTSLKESGKSRADLWQFAGNIGLERAINITNQNCLLGMIDNDGNPERQLSAIGGHISSSLLFSEIAHRGRCFSSLFGTFFNNFFKYFQNPTIPFNSR